MEADFWEIFSLPQLSSSNLRKALIIFPCAARHISLSHLEIKSSWTQHAKMHHTLFLMKGRSSWLAVWGRLPWSWWPHHSHLTHKMMKQWRHHHLSQIKVPFLSAAQPSWTTLAFPQVLSKGKNKCHPTRHNRKIIPTVAGISQLKIYLLCVSACKVQFSLRNLKGIWLQRWN